MRRFCASAQKDAIRSSNPPNDLKEQAFMAADILAPERNESSGSNIRAITDVNNTGQTFVMNQLRCGPTMTLHLVRDFVQCHCIMLSLDRQGAGLEGLLSTQASDLRADVVA
jgi:hypothetical protein